MLEWITNALQDILNFFATIVDYLGMMIRNIITGIQDAFLIIQTTWRFIGELPSLFGWLPYEIYYLLFMALLVICLISVIKLIGQVL